tara:strand:+ start:477 stop:1244 length:768 start_codon:yes stop_codon:yes gene_type:complete
MKVITINVCGIRASQKKGLFEWLKKTKADFICMQETRALEEQVSENSFLLKGYERYMNVAEKKGYSGVAVYTKHKPLSIKKSFSKSIFEKEGRFLLVEFKDFDIVSIYFPSGSSSDERQLLKYEFMNLFEKFVKSKVKNGREMIICGDYNIAHTKDDIKNWKTNQMNSGFLPREREWMTKLINKVGLRDAFREKCKRSDIYTWWSNRGNAYNNNVGWRIDYQMVTENFSRKIKSVSVYNKSRYSDHAPLVINYDA